MATLMNRFDNKILITQDCKLNLDIQKHQLHSAQQVQSRWTDRRTCSWNIYSHCFSIPSEFTHAHSGDQQLRTHTQLWCSFAINCLLIEIFVTRWFWSTITNMIICVIWYIVYELYIMWILHLFIGLGNQKFTYKCRLYFQMATMAFMLLL